MRLPQVVCALVLSLTLTAASRAQPSPGHTLGIEGTRFTLDGEPFSYTGVSFFNALFNPAFNETSEARRAWLRKFKGYGVNVIRVWGQWDNARGFVDACPTCTLYRADGSLEPAYAERLVEIARDADAEGMALLLALYARESRRENIRLSPEASDRATAAVARLLRPYRNVALQIWNEHDERVAEHVKTIKGVDPARLVTNAPGFSGDLGSDAENRALDFLSPHTSRHTDAHWRIAPHEIGLLRAKYGKPVVDDEPARNGTKAFGGPGERTSPFDHILHIAGVWAAGGYVVYHHDMFQTGAGAPEVPPSGIPDPEFSSYHRMVFEFLALRERYAPRGDHR